MQQCITRLAKQTCIAIYERNPILAMDGIRDGRNCKEITKAPTHLCCPVNPSETATTLGLRFRFYSIGTILVYLVLGILPFLGVAQVEAGQSTPWVGLVERIMVYGYMLWVLILANVLLRSEKDQAQITAIISNLAIDAIYGRMLLLQA